MARRAMSLRSCREGRSCREFVMGYRLPALRRGDGRPPSIRHSIALRSPAAGLRAFMHVRLLRLRPLAYHERLTFEGGRPMMRFPSASRLVSCARLVGHRSPWPRSGATCTNTRDPQPSRAFSRITFGPSAAQARAGVEAAWPDSTGCSSGARVCRRSRSRPSRTARVARLRDARRSGDPSIKSSMPVVSVDERADPKSVIKVPDCQPRK